MFVANDCISVRTHFSLYGAGRLGNASAMIWHALADRLYSRGISEFSTHTTEQSRDLRIASQALRVLLNEIDKVAAIAGDVAHQLRNLRVTVES